jgi:hypothetical protein
MLGVARWCFFPLAIVLSVVAQIEDKQVPQEATESVDAEAILEPIKTEGEISPKPQEKQSEPPTIVTPKATEEKQSESPKVTEKKAKEETKIVSPQATVSTRVLDPQEEMTELEDIAYSIFGNIEAKLSDSSFNLSAMERKDLQEGYNHFHGAFEGTRPEVNISIDAKLTLLRKATEKHQEWNSKLGSFGERREKEQERLRKIREAEEARNFINASRRLAMETPGEKKQRLIRDVNDTVIELEDICYSMFSSLHDRLSNAMTYNLSEAEAKDFTEGYKLFYGAFQKSQSGDIDKEGKIPLLMNATKKAAEYVTKVGAVNERKAAMEKKKEEARAEARRREEAMESNITRRLHMETPEERKKRFQADMNDTVTDLEDEVYGMFGNLESKLKDPSYFLSDLERKDFSQAFELFKGAFEKSKSGDVDKDGKIMVLRNATQKLQEYRTKLATVSERRDNPDKKPKEVPYTKPKEVEKPKEEHKTVAKPKEEEEDMAKPSSSADTSHAS